MWGGEMILCCGEALIDMVPRRLETGEEAFLPLPGGAVFNTAITLGRLGARAGFLSGISTDLFGEQLIEYLHNSHVDTSLCVRKNNPTTLAFVKLTDGQAKYTFIDENSAGRMLSVPDLPNLSSEIEALHFGAISLIPEPCGTAYETLMTRHRSEAVISLDPNIRPEFIADPESHRARINRLIEMSDIVKVSDEDLDWIAPGLESSSAAEAIIAEKGASVVILTKGSEGVTVFNPQGRFDVAAIPVKVVDTIGAGDSFNGGFLTGLREAGLLDREALKRAMVEKLRPVTEFAVKVAAVTVSRAGANPPWREEVT